MSSLLTRLRITLGRSDADEHALNALESDASVAVTPGPVIEMMPSSPNDTGVILYPGGRCDARAYAPVMRPLAEAGFRVFLCQMPLRLAVLDVNRAARVMGLNTDIKRWIVGGHSMGGAMAAAFNYKNADKVAGLFFMASYPAAMHAVPETTTPIAMIYGTCDTITRQNEFEASHERLPSHTRYIGIAGGDHYQFGSFSDVPISATITRREQQEQTSAALVEFSTQL